MEKGINFEIIWFDQDVIEVVLTCSNGHFSGWAEIYLSHDDLPELADALRGFPSGVSDTRQIELGTLDPNYANGGARIQFYCSDSSGHAVLEIQLRGDRCKALGEVESVALRMPIEAAGVDSFVHQLVLMKSTIGASASLPMAR